MTNTQTVERIAGFARAVREALNDLPTAEIDDLVDGLEADLAEQASDGGEAFDPGEPAAYAAELRAAAGLAERHDPAGQRRFPVTVFGRDLWNRAQIMMRSTRPGSWLFDTVLSLRPIWWLARGWTFYVGIAPWLGAKYDVFFLPGSNVYGWTLIIAALLLSVQWGRGLWARPQWVQNVRMLANLVAVVVFPFLLLAGAVSSAQRAIQ